MIERFKKAKPLTARWLEDSLPVRVDASQLVLAVKSSAISGERLFDSQVQAKLKGELQEVFGYAPRVEVRKFESLPLAEMDPLPKTLYELKLERQLARNQKIEQDLRDHHLTQAILAGFDGTIVDVSLGGPS